MLRRGNGFSFSGEEFASLFCRGGDRFAHRELPEELWERAREKLEKRDEGKQDRVHGARLSFSAESAGVQLKLLFTCHCVEKQGEDYVLEQLFCHYGNTPKEDPALLAHALCAGALLCRQRKRERVILKKTFCRLPDGKLQSETSTLCAEEASACLNGALQRAFSLLSLLREGEGKIAFPYPSLREGQRELMEQCLSAVKEKRSLMVCAPTGVGKTLSFLYPALKAVEKGRAARVLFLTPKGSTQRQIQEASRLLDGKANHCPSVILFARQTHCRHQSRCLREKCDCVKDHESRLFPAALALFGKSRHLSPEGTEEVARQFRLCPFALSLYAARFCRVVIGDYNFVFDPKTGIKVLADGEGVLLVDEAHNLPDRVRENLSFSLDPALEEQLREAFPQGGEEELAALKDCFSREAERLSQGGDPFSLAPPQQEEQLAARLTGALFPRWDREQEAQNEGMHQLRSFTEACRDFSRGYVAARREDGGVKLCLCDPSAQIRQMARAFGTPVYFSATLLPKEYFFPVLGGESRDLFWESESPFDPGRLLLCAVPVQTALAKRGESLRSLCRFLAVACEKKGRYLAFFPSFEYLQRVESMLSSFHPKLLCFSQRPAMSALSRRSFWEALDRGDREQSVLGLCVLGGLFAEGVELKEHSLDGVMVVGTGMAPPSLEREAQSRYYGEQDADGKAFSYALPGFHKVLQAVGRLIRKERDRGFALLCDKRYTDGSYAECYPRHWNEPVICPTPRELRELLFRFWEGE